MGLSSESLPLVLQYNKRDLADILSVDELNRLMNPHGWPAFEASALTGQGVFETLKGVSKLTLLSLKKRLTRGGESAATTPTRPAPPRPGPAPAPAAAPKPPAPAAAVPSKPSAPAPAMAAMPATAAAARQPAARSRSSADVLGELEKLRREAMQPAGSAPAAHAAGDPATPPPPAAGRPAAPKNGRGELSRNIELTLKRADFERARRIRVSFQVEDDQSRVMDSVRDLPVEIKDAASLEKLLLRLNIALNAKE
jgi:pyruvate/2-oxoglutarate dehydrogenase complex dihydrolipoamide acyltransferase (E2) component